MSDGKAVAVVIVDVLAAVELDEVGFVLAVEVEVVETTLVRNEEESSSEDLRLLAPTTVEDEVLAAAEEDKTKEKTKRPPRTWLS